MRVVVAIACCLLGCGRFGFGNSDNGDGGGSGGDDGDVDAHITTGAAGARWAKQLGDTGFRVAIAGINGELAVLQPFSGTFSGDGVNFTGVGFTSTALVRYASDGSIEFSRKLDSDGFCDMRVLFVEGDEMTLGGYSGSVTTTPALGACSITTNRQDPVVLHIDAAGTETVLTHWIASTTNAQIWGGARFPSGQMVFSGVYSGGLNTGSALPAAQADPNAFVARTFTGNPMSSSWSQHMSSTTEVHAGPVATSGTHVCMMGAFAGTPTLMGVAMTNNGGYDTWVARKDEDGTMGFIRPFGSGVDEPGYGGNQSLLALPDGGCLVSEPVTGDVTVDGIPLPVSAGEGVLIRFSDTGTVIDAHRMQHALRLAQVGTTTYAAMSIDATLDLGGGQIYNPSGIGVVILELAADYAPLRIVAAIDGAGDQYVEALAPIHPDALGVSISSTGAFQFGATELDTGAVNVRIVGVLGL